MNRDQLPPDDAGQGADSAELAQIEQQLRSVRPRPPELDVEAILCAARTEDRPVGLAECPSRVAGTRGYGSIGTLAGSWACGAMVGAVVMFMLLGRAVAPESPRPVATAAQDELPKVAESGQGPATDGGASQVGRDDSAQRESPWSRAETRVFVMLLDPYGAGGRHYAEPRRPLRAGTFALRQAPEGAWQSRHVTDATLRNWVATPEPSNNIQQDLTTPPAPARGTTRQELLRELLNGSRESVL